MHSDQVAFNIGRLCEIADGKSVVDIYIYCPLDDSFHLMVPYTRHLDTALWQSSRIAQLVLFAFGPNSDHLGPERIAPAKLESDAFTMKSISMAARLYNFHCEIQYQVHHHCKD